MSTMESEKETPVKLYTMEEVKKHNDIKNTWIVIHNSVYNVTDFLNEHPGGEEVLLEQAGRNGSEAFEDVGHSSDAREMMSQFKIGELVEEDRVNTDNKKGPSWNSPDSPATNSSWKSWLVPIVLGLLATIIYRFFLLKQ